VIDSLDESEHIPTKYREIRSLLRFREEANSLARRRGYVAFPMMLVFTVRDDYWRHWESLFEGQPGMHTARKRFSRFNDSELRAALAKYGAAYRFEIGRQLNPEEIDVLSTPFNLKVYSEANQYAGNICPPNLITDDVISLYLDRKKTILRSTKYYPRIRRGFSCYMRSLWKKLTSQRRFNTNYL
jgi:hypothetical protein